ncbi:MAG: hypothetical protein ACREND_06910 [Gemmatimonadaceae bacterium]
MRVLLRLLQSFALYLGTVVGGVTLFLIIAPLFGYLSYSDRPGPVWFGGFPALGWQQFWANAGDMLGYGAFLGLLFIIPGAVAVLIAWGIERWIRHPVLARGLAAVVAALGAGYWMLGAGWYIAAGPALLVVAVVLGGVAGAGLLVRQRQFPDHGA